MNAMSMNELLSQLSQVCSTLYDQASSFVSSDPVADSRILDFLLPFPELNLDIPSPDYLVNTLVGVGAPDLLARELSEIHAKSSVELADHYLQNYRDACSEIVSVDQEDRMKSYLRLQQAACRMYKRTVMSWETSLLQSIRDRLRNGGGGVGVKKQPAKGPSFNTVSLSNYSIRVHALRNSPELRTSPRRDIQGESISVSSRETYFGAEIWDEHRSD